MRLVVSRDQANVVTAAKSRFGLFIAVFVLLEEIGELLVVCQLLLLHGHNLLDVALEVA